MAAHPIQTLSVSMAGSFHGLHKIHWKDFVVNGGIWRIDLKSHWVRAVEMSRIGPIEFVELDVNSQCS